MDVKIPEVGESIFEATIAKWHKQEGDQVEKDEMLCELETDKITLELNAEAAGTLSIKAAEGETLKIGAVIAHIAESGQASKDQEPAAEEPKPAESPKPEQAAKPAPAAKPEPKAESAPAPAVKPATPRKPTPIAAAAPSIAPTPEAEGRITRTPMSPIRKKIASHLLAARQQTAMLTTFNEADMSRLKELRKRHKESFEAKHGVPLGFMSFFVKASIEALKEFPEVNARIDGDDIVHQHFYNIGIAIGAEKGLVVPVIKDAEECHFADIEQAIVDFVDKIKKNRLGLADLEGGTFTISNGGVYGSMLSTPILNPPQSAVLGMHAIKDRPVAVDGKVEIRPMMYLALSYDHRIIDGREAVNFLKRIVELIEEPEEMLLEL